MYVFKFHIDDLAQDCSNSIANVLELLQSCTKPSISSLFFILSAAIARKTQFPPPGAVQSWICEDASGCPAEVPAASSWSPGALLQQPLPNVPHSKAMGKNMEINSLQKNMDLVTVSC